MVYLNKDNDVQVETRSETWSKMQRRARGCLLGQFAGDSLGSLVEFRSPEYISDLYPNGVRDMADGGSFNTIAGQLTDDSEMALMLAHSLIDRGTFVVEDVRRGYKFWLDSNPFDCGMTIGNALGGASRPDSQANGALMRISPLGIFGVGHATAQVSTWARADAALTHPNQVCLDINALFTVALSYAISHGCGREDLFGFIEANAQAWQVEPFVWDLIATSKDADRFDYTEQSGWVALAFSNALRQLLYAPSLEEAVVNTIALGGDTDTNAAICGALLGAVEGEDAVPKRWVDALLNCRPSEGVKGVENPRPQVFWPVDVLNIADRLLAAGLRG
ncbi:MAG: ADP-ribosylglycohydrolase family protein [Actinomycetaceae bacterium]|nr:ADP-ribosylglycohydrolase family protein [Actinomycetaceae bacterium]